MRYSWLLPPAFVAFLLAGCSSLQTASSGSPLNMVVMDPLAAPLACPCVGGYAQRRYDRLVGQMARRLNREVRVFYTEALESLQGLAPEDVDLIIGKVSVIKADARKMGIGRVWPWAMLTGLDGTVTQRGLFVVRTDDPAETVEDLAGADIVIGPCEAVEKHDAALRTLELFGVTPKSLREVESCNAGALAVAEGDARAAAISSYAMPLLEGCGTIDKGTLRVLARTDPVPFVGVFGRRPAAQMTEVVRSITEIDSTALMRDMESARGFLTAPEVRWYSSSWFPHGIHNGDERAEVPGGVPELHTLWRRTLTGPGMAGLALARGSRVMVADKSYDAKEDIFRCLDADTGEQLWHIRYPAAGDMDFTNTPRATPCFTCPSVYLFGAFGDLRCVNAWSGEVVWQTNLAEQFSTKMPQWGYSSTPLSHGGKLIVNPGAPDASLVALDRRTGDVIWRTPGKTAAYASFVTGELGGVNQLVGYDSVSLGGWDIDTGKRLWTLIPLIEGDFNVPTPIVLDGKLLVASENNGTRLYAFNDDGSIVPEPIASNDDLKPDTSSPVVIGDLVFGADGTLRCLDLNDGLKTLWTCDDEAFAGYCSLMACRGRLLVTSQSGEISLLDLDRAKPRLVARWTPFAGDPETDRDIWSHPVLAGNRLYVRNGLGVSCFLFVDPRVCRSGWR